MRIVAFAHVGLSAYLLLHTPSFPQNSHSDTLEEEKRLFPRTSFTSLLTSQKSGTHKMLERNIKSPSLLPFSDVPTSVVPQDVNFA